MQTDLSSEPCHPPDRAWTAGGAAVALLAALALGCSIVAPYFA